MIKTHTAEILFVEALENYVYVHTARRKYLTLISLKNVEKHLPEDQFIKVQKSFLVAMDKIESVDKNDIIIGEHKFLSTRNGRKRY